VGVHWDPCLSPDNYDQGRLGRMHTSLSSKQPWWLRPPDDSDLLCCCRRQSLYH